MIRFARILTVSLLCCVPVWATVRNVQTCGATGNGTTDDTAAIKTCINQLVSGDTLEFPAGTYKTTSQLVINVSSITVDGSSGAATIVGAGGLTSSILRIGQSGFGNTNAALGSPVALSATANEGATSFATIASLGASIGSLVYLQQGGRDSSGGSGDTACDTSGCRGEVVQIRGVSGNTYTVTTMLHDTWNPSVNAATAQLVSSVLSNVVVQNIKFNGNATNQDGFELNSCLNCTVSGVTSTNVLGAAIISSVTFGGSWSNITITLAGSVFCGDAMDMLVHGNLTINTVSITNMNTNVNTCSESPMALAAGFGLSGTANGVVSNLTIVGASGGGRPFKLTATRYTTFNNITESNAAGAFNGLSLEYYSSKNLFNGCSVTNNAAGSGSGGAGINSFGNFNEYNTFYNCTVTGNGNVQIYNSNADALHLAQDWYDSYYGNTMGGSGTTGLLQYGSNGCVNGNILNAGLSAGISVSSPSTGTVGSGNTLNGTSSNLSAGSCGTTGTHGSGGLAGLSSSSISFGGQTLNTTSGTQTVTLTNGIGPYSGTNVLTFASATSLTMGTQFAISTSTCSGTVPAGGTCTVTLTFTPTSTGAQSDTLTFLDSAGGAYQTVTLSGTGLVPAISYYVSSSSGSDGNNGTSAATPWATLGAHVNGGTFAVGSVINLKRGDTWNEQLIPPSPGAAGNPISFDGYGTGAAPVLTPVINLAGTNWTHNSGDIYTTTLSTAIASPQINSLQLGKLWGRKRSPSPGCTSAGVILGYGDFCVVYPTLYVYSPNGTLPSTYYSSIVPVVGQASGLAMVSIVGKSWITVQHIKVQSFDYMGVSVTGASDNLVFANIEVDGMVPYGATPLGFYVNAASPANIQFVNDDAYFNYDGFRFDGTATAITVINCRGYANRDAGLKDNTGHATYSYSHFYGNNVAQFPTSDVVGGIAGSGDISSAIAPVVTNFATYPARFSFTVDDVGSQPNTEAYVNSFLTTFNSRGLYFNAAVVPSYTVDWGSVNSWYTAGNEIDSHSWSHQYYTTNTNPQNATPYPNAPALDIQYTGSGTAATLSIASGMLTTSVTGASGDNLSITLADSPYNTMQGLEQYLAMIPHYSISYDHSGPLVRPNTHSVNLLNVTNQNIKGTAVVLLYDQTKLEPDEMTASKTAIQAKVPGLTEAFYVYPDGIEDTTTEADASAAGYTAARGSLAMKGQDNATGGANSLYSNGVNIQNIASLAAIQIHGMTQAQITQMAASLVFRAAAWGIPYGLFTHYNTRGDNTPDISNTELGYLLDAVKANGGVWLTNTGIANALTAGSGLSGSTRYVQNPTGGELDLTVAGANSPVVGRGAATAYAVDLDGTNRATLGTWDIGASTYLSQRYGGGGGSGNTYIGGWPVTSMVQLPQNWVNNNECNTNYTYELQFPGTWISSTPLGWRTTLPYANTAAGMQQAINDLESYRTSTGKGTRLDIPPGLYSQAGGLVIPQSSSSVATQCNVVASTQDSSLPNGRTVCAHGIQDNLATSADPGLDNPDCAGDAMYYQLGTTQTTVPAGSFTFANGTVTDTSAFNDVQYMFTLEGSGATPTAMRFCSPTSTSLSTGTPPPCTSTTLAPDHWLIEDMEARMQAGNTASQDIISMSTAFNETSTTEYPQHIHFRKDWVHGDWTSLTAGRNSVSNAFDFWCMNCSIMDSQTSQNLKPGAEGHSVLTSGQINKFSHNWFEGQGIGMLDGGFCTAFPVPGYIAFIDIEERRNRFTFPYAWLGVIHIPSGNTQWTGYSLTRKNGNEMKAGERVLRQGNIIENVDNSGGQGGPAGDVKSPNNSCSLGTNYQVATTDITDDSNIWRNACQVLQLVRSPGPNTSGVSHGIDRYSINNSLWYNISGTNYGCSTNLGLMTSFGAWEWQGTVKENAAGTQATFTANCSVDQVQCVGQISGFTVNTGGTGCVAGSLTIGAPDLVGGRQAKGSYTCSSGALSTATVTNNGSGYSSAPTVSLATGTGTLTANLVASSTAPGTGYETFDLNPGDPVSITQCSSVTAFNQPTANHSGTWLPSGIGPNAISTTTLSATIPWTATAGASDSAGYCKLSNIQGFPRGLQFTHNTVISDASLLLTWGNGIDNGLGDGPNFQVNSLFQNDIMIGAGGINNSPIGEGNPTINFDFDATTLTLDHTVWPGRSSSSYTPLGNNPNFPVTSPTIYLGSTPATSYCTGSSPTSSCVGFTGAMSTSSMPLVLPDYHSFALATGSSFKSGGTNQASDGTDLGVNMAAIDAAETSTKYVCTAACGSGPSGDVVSTDGH